MTATHRATGPPSITGIAGPPLPIALHGVHAAYGGIEVLHGVDLSVGPGEIVALLGPNGGGKSTTLRVIAGQVAATSGDVVLAGRRINGAMADDLARRGLCLVPEGRGVFPNLTVRENLWMDTHGGVALRSVEDVAYARFPRLGDRRSQLAGTLSGGEQQMLALARALATDPAVLMVDELSMGLAPLVVRGLYELVGAVAADGVSVLLVEQFARAVLGIADRAVVMVHGRVTASGRPADIEADLSTAYLGARGASSP